MAARGLLSRLPHDPRIYVANQSAGIWQEQVIHSPCGDTPLPPLAEGEEVRLDLKPRPGCKYRIHCDTLEGDYLINLIELARRERADVRTIVDIDRVIADVTAGY